MKENLFYILQWLQQAFNDYNIDPLLLIDPFLSKGILNTEEEAIIKHHVTRKRQIIEFCGILRSKPNECLTDIQQIAFANNWSAILDYVAAELNKHDMLALIYNTPATAIFQEKPFCFDLKRPAKGFVGREIEIDAIHKIVSQNVGKRANDRDDDSLVIHGLGGVGKTELVLNYCRKCKNELDSIVWINAESTHSVMASIQKLADKLSMEYKSYTIDVLGKVLAKKLADIGPKRLTIFDNADGIDTTTSTDTDCYKNFPKEFLAEHFFIIINRHAEWQDSAMQRVGALESNAATNLVAEIVGQKKDAMDGVEELLSKLEYFPLALKHAAGYIKMKNKFSSKNYSCRNYLLDYDANVKDVKDLINYEQTKMEYITSSIVAVYTTWKVTFEKIQSLRYPDTIKDNLVNFTNEILPAKILNMVSFLCAENISVDLFSEISTAEHHLWWALNTLENFSIIIIDTDNGSFSVHKLVQEVTRLNIMHKNGLSEEIIKGANNLVVKYFPLNTKTEYYSKQRNLFPHLMELKYHFNQLQQKTQLATSDDFELTYNCILQACFSLGNAQIRKIVSEELLTIKEARYGKQHIRIIGALEHLGNAYGKLGDPQTMKSLLERALAVEEQNYGPDHFVVAITLVNLSNVYEDLGDPKTQKTLLERALKIQEHHYSPDHFEVANTLMNLGNAYGALGDPKTQKTLLEKALKIQEHHYGPDHFGVANILMNLCNAYDAVGDPKTQKTILDRALKIQEHHYGPDHFEVAKTLVNLSNAHFYLGAPKNTQKTLLERALKIQEHHYGPDHFEVAITLVNLSSVYGDLSDPKTQKTLLERALKIKEHHYGPYHFQVANTLVTLSNVHYYLGDPKTQKMLLDRALKIQEHHYGPDHFRVAITLENLGIAHGDLDDPITKKTLLERALEIQEHHYGPYRFGVANSLVNLSNAYGALGDPKTQKTLLERALKIQERHYGPDHFRVAITLENLGVAYRNLGDPKTQKTLLERALKIQEHQ